jgi:hypothetical protein
MSTPTLSVFEFLDEASTNVFLQKIRQESTPAIQTNKRLQSPSLKALLAKYDGRACNTADTSCLTAYIRNQVATVRAFDFEPDEAGLARLGSELKKLALVVEHMYHNGNSLRDYFSTLTEAFAGRFVPVFKESRKKGLRMDMVRNILHGDAARVQAVLAAAHARLQDELSDQESVEYADVQRAILFLWDQGMAKGATRKNVIGLMLALELSCGARKIAYLDPTILFYTWTDWQTTNPTVRLGFGLDYAGDDAATEEERIILDPVAYDRLMTDPDGASPVDHLLVQVGIPKSADQGDNIFFDENDIRYVQNRSITKPTLTLTAQQVVKAVARIRKFFKITKETWSGKRAKEGNKIGSRDIRPVIQKFFPALYASRVAKDKQIGSHLMRKIYAVSAWQIIGTRMKQVAGRRVNIAIFIASILGHGQNSTHTYLRYTTLDVLFKIADQALQTPPTEQMRRINALVTDLQRQINELQNPPPVAVRAALSTTVEIKDEDGVFHVFKRHEATNWKNAEHRNQVLGGYADQLTEANIPVTKANLMKFGLGGVVVQSHLTHRRNAPLVADPEPVQIIRDRALRPGGIATAVMPPETRVIAVTDPDASENTKRQQIKRARESFGLANIIETAEDCNGQVLKKQKIKTSKGTTVLRDICVGDKK